MASPKAKIVRRGPPVKPDSERARSVNTSLPGPVAATCAEIVKGRPVDGVRALALAAHEAMKTATGKARLQEFLSDYGGN